MARFLSGIQPSGLPHLGNYYGAIRQHLDLQHEGEGFYFIADLHALTTIAEPDRLRAYVREIAATYLALGLDPRRVTFWRQSDVPEVTEIAWLLANVCGTGLLERAHSYKDKIARGIAPNVGLFYYPLLMAADILAYDADFVPVGQDQVQHIEITQDVGGSFNARYGEVFKRPEPRLSKQAKVLGLDGQKMSKSYGNAVWIFEEGKALKKLIGRIATDSRPPDEPKEPEGLLLYGWLELLLPEDEYAELVRRSRAGGAEGPGYGELKQRLCAAIEETFAAGRGERKRLLEHPEEIERILAEGAERARVQARAVRDRAYRACGLR